MSDFLVWASDVPLPRAIRRAFHWNAPETLGVRRGPPYPIAQARLPGVQTLVLGSPLARRDGPRLSPLEIATELAHQFPHRAWASLDEFLGPFCGVVLRGDEIFVYRDRFGLHPIQYLRLPSGWAISNCPDTLLTILRISSPSPLLHSGRLDSFLRGEAPEDSQDYFVDLYRLRPAECLSLQSNRITRRHYYWHPRPTPSRDPAGTLRNWFFRRHDRLGTSPTVLGLSSGMDSAALGAFISQRHGQSQCFTFVDTDGVDESSEAQHLASTLGVRWHRIEIRNHWPLRNLTLPPTPSLWGPIAHPDLAWKMAAHKRFHNVPLLPFMYGNGADEALWVTQSDWLISRWKQLDTSSLSEAARHLPLRTLAAPLLPPLPALHLRQSLHRWRRRPSWQTPENWLGPPAEPPPPHDSHDVHPRLHHLRSWHWERAMRSLASEARLFLRPIWTPYLDAEFWELCLCLKPDDLVQQGRQKAVLRQCCADVLPHSFLSRGKLGGFDPLVERGLAIHEREGITTMMGQSRLQDSLQFQSAIFLHAYRDYCESGGTTIRGSWDIWRTLTAEFWMRRVNQFAPTFFQDSGGL